MKFPNKKNHLGLNIIRCIAFVMIGHFFLAMCCCESRHNAVYTLVELREELKEHSTEYSKTDWENAMNEYAVVCQELDQMELTDEERKEILRIKGEIVGIATNSMVKQFIENTDELVNSFAIFFEGMEDGLDIKSKNE